MPPARPSLRRNWHELDEWIMAQVEVIAHDRRIIVTDHDVLAYFAQRYGFELLDSVVPGVSTAAEPSVRHLAELRELIAEHGIRRSSSAPP